MNEWISVKDRLPESDSFNELNMAVAVVIHNPATLDKGFFKGIPASTEIVFAYWSFRQQLFPKSRTTTESVYEHKWGFYPNKFEKEEPLKNVTHWMPLPAHPSEQ